MKCDATSARKYGIDRASVTVGFHGRPLYNFRDIRGRRQRAGLRLISPRLGSRDLFFLIFAENVLHDIIKQSSGN